MNGWNLSILVNFTDQINKITISVGNFKWFLISTSYSTSIRTSIILHQKCLSDGHSFINPLPPHLSDVSIGGLCMTISITFQNQKIQIQHSVTSYSDWPGVWRWESKLDLNTLWTLSTSFCLCYTTIYVTFQMNNQVQHYECLQKKLYENVHMVLPLSMTAGLLPHLSAGWM